MNYKDIYNINTAILGCKELFLTVRSFYRKKMWWRIKYISLEDASKKFYKETYKLQTTIQLINETKEKTIIKIFRKLAKEEKIKLYGSDAYSKKLREIPNDILGWYFEKDHKTYSIYQLPKRLTDPEKEYQIYTNICMKRKDLKAIIKNYINL